MIRFLAENNDYKVYSIYESVYLKLKIKSKNLFGFETEDRFITHHYGDPNNAIILNSNTHIIVSGCGLSIYDILKDKEIHILAEANNITWTNSLHQDENDNQSTEFRYEALSEKGEMKVFKLEIESYKITEI